MTDTLKSLRDTVSGALRAVEEARAFLSAAVTAERFEAGERARRAETAKGLDYARGRADERVDILRGLREDLDTHNEEGTDPDVEEIIEGIECGYHISEFSVIDEAVEPVALPPGGPKPFTDRNTLELQLRAMSEALESIASTVGVDPLDEAGSINIVAAVEVIAAERIEAGAVVTRLAEAVGANPSLPALAIERHVKHAIERRPSARGYQPTNPRALHTPPRSPGPTRAVDVRGEAARATAAEAMAERERIEAGGKVDGERKSERTWADGVKEGRRVERDDILNSIARAFRLVPKESTMASALGNVTDLIEGRPNREGKLKRRLSWTDRDFLEIQARTADEVLLRIAGLVGVDAPRDAGSIHKIKTLNSIIAAVKILAEGDIDAKEAADPQVEE